jgi:zona occludens toxin (predicted ATPase)
MATCPKCHGDIPAQATRCQHCAADLRSWFARHKILTGLLSLVILVFLISMFSGPSSTSSSTGSTSTSSNTATSPSKPAEVAMRITAEALAAAYTANEVAADATYKDKLVEVTGTVMSISQDFLDNPTVTLSDGHEYSFNNPQCSFPKERAAQVADLTKGQKVTLQGRVSGEVIGTAMIKECSVVTP